MLTNYCHTKFNDYDIFILRTFIIQIHGITLYVENYLVTLKPVLFIDFDQRVIQNNFISGI